MSVLPVDVTIGGRTYRLAAPAGQEARLKALAARVDAVVEDIRQGNSDIDRDRHLILTCLQLVSSLDDSHQKLDAQTMAVTHFHRRLSERLERMLDAEARPAPAESV